MKVSQIRMLILLPVLCAVLTASQPVTAATITHISAAGIPISYDFDQSLLTMNDPSDSSVALTVTYADSSEETIFGTSVSGLFDMYDDSDSTGGIAIGHFTSSTGSQLEIKDPNGVDLFTATADLLTLTEVNMGLDAGPFTGAGDYSNGATGRSLSGHAMGADGDLLLVMNLSLTWYQDPNYAVPINSISNFTKLDDPNGLSVIYGRFVLDIIPEPASIVLLACGSMLVSRGSGRRRRPN